MLSFPNYFFACTCSLPKLFVISKPSGIFKSSIITTLLSSFNQYYLIQGRALGKTLSLFSKLRFLNPLIWPKQFGDLQKHLKLNPS